MVWSLLPLGFSLGCCQLEAVSPACWGCRDILYIHTYIYKGIAFMDLGDVVLMFGTGGALEMPSFMESRWAAAKKRDLFLFGASVGIRSHLFLYGAEEG